MNVNLRAKFEISSIVLTNLRLGEGGGIILPTPPTSK